MNSSRPPQPDHEQRTQDFVRLLSQHERSLNGYILALVPNLSDADEIAQETKLRLWQQFNNYEADKDFGAWARTIAFYQVRRFRTQAGRERLKFSEEFLDTVAEEVASTTDLHEARQRYLIECMQRLTEDSRKLIRRYYSTMGSVAEVAGYFGRTVEATKKALVRIRRNLRECVERAMRREGPS